MALSGSQVTQHGISGYTQIKYGSFSGKTPAPVSDPPQNTKIKLAISVGI